jgi:hypothetical protein
VGPTGPAGSRGPTGPTGRFIGTITADTLWISDGVYVPDTLHLSNARHYAGFAATWSQLDSLISVNGTLQIQASAPGVIQVGLSLPVSANPVYPSILMRGLVTTGNGTKTGVVNEGAGNVAQLNIYTTDTGTYTYHYTFTYVTRNYVPGKIVQAMQGVTGPTGPSGNPYWTPGFGTLSTTDTTANIGVGTAFPLANLHVNGTLLNRVDYRNADISVLSDGFDVLSLGIQGMESVHRFNDGTFAGALYGRFTSFTGNAKGFIYGIFDLNSHACTVEGHWDAVRNSFYTQWGAVRSNDTLSLIKGVDSAGFDIVTSLGSASSHVYVRSPLSASAVMQIVAAPGHSCLQLHDSTARFGRVLMATDTFGNARWQLNTPSLDSTSLYALTAVPTGQTYYCTNCHGNAPNYLTGGLVSYNGSLWRRNF